MRNADDQKHGIVKTIGKYGSIEEATYYEDKPHGLSFAWRYNYAFIATIYNHGERKARIIWRDDWSEEYSDGDKELILENNGLSILKP